LPFPCSSPIPFYISCRLSSPRSFVTLLNLQNISLVKKEQSEFLVYVSVLSSHWRCSSMKTFSVTGYSWVRSSFQRDTNLIKVIKTYLKTNTVQRTYTVNSYTATLCLQAIISCSLLIFVHFILPPQFWSTSEFWRIWLQPTQNKQTS
jgi:hypothetical protein